MEDRTELCFGRDGQGRRWAAWVPRGLARPGMMVRLLGGVFLRVELVGGRELPGVPVRQAVELLTSVWGRDHHD